jgi:hypothetical protein
VGFAYNLGMSQAVRQKCCVLAGFFEAINRLSTKSYGNKMFAWMSAATY